MNNKGNIPAPGNIERELMERIEKDEVTKTQKNTYKTGVRIGLAVIFAAAAVFILLMFVMPSEPSPVYWAGCGLAVVLMIASIAVVSARLRRLQAGYFGSAGAAAQDYADELARRMKSDGK
jgi:membrane protein YdbS with pleckstrin-like domain